MKTKNKAKPVKKKMKYSTGNMPKALDAVKNGMRRKQAAKVFQVPRSTIQFRLNNPNKLNPQPGPITVLKDVDENALVNWMIESSKRGFPRRKEDIQHSVSGLLTKDHDRPNLFKNDYPSDKWIKLFLKRHQIAVRTLESATTASSLVSESVIRGWFIGIEKYLKDNEFFNILSDPSRVFNGDETNFLLCPRSSVVITLKGDKNVHEVDRGQAKPAITVELTICANGDLITPMVILPYKRVLEYISTVPKDWGVGVSVDGWMKANLFYDYIKNVLHPHLKGKGIIFPVILFVDGSKTRQTLQISKLCADLKIILIALYPKCSRFLEPDDAAAFFPVKYALARSGLRWRRKHPALALTKLEFLNILKTAIDVNLTPDTIKRGFRACGLQPWNPDALHYTKYSDISKDILTRLHQHIEVDNHNLNGMTKGDFIKIVGRENIMKLKNKNPNMIHDASKLLQKLWKFFDGHSSETN